MKSMASSPSLFRQAGALMLGVWPVPSTTSRVPTPWYHQAARSGYSSCRSKFQAGRWCFVRLCVKFERAGCTNTCSFGPARYLQDTQQNKTFNLVSVSAYFYTTPSGVVFSWRRNSRIRFWPIVCFYFVTSFWK